jgi:hypothetical protein
MLGYMGTTKEHMLLNVNKETRLYSVKHMTDGKIKVDNAYEFLLQNTENDNMKFFFEVLPPKGIDGKIFIAKPTKPFNVVPGIKKKKIVVLRTTDVLVRDDRKDTIIPITIHAYALDKDGKPSKKISVLRESTFIFPKENILKAAK